MFEDDKIVETKAIKNLRDRFKKILMLFGLALISLLFSKYDVIYNIKTVFLLLIFIVTVYLSYIIYQLEEELDKLKTKINNLSYDQVITEKRVNNIANFVFNKTDDLDK